MAGGNGALEAWNRKWGQSESGEQIAHSGNENRLRLLLIFFLIFISESFKGGSYFLLNVFRLRLKRDETSVVDRLRLEYVVDLCLYVEKGCHWRRHLCALLAIVFIHYINASFFILSLSLFNISFSVKIKNLLGKEKLLKFSKFICCIVVMPQFVANRK